VASYSFSREPKEVKIIRTKNREIKTKIPAPGTVEILEKLDKYESRSMHGQLPIIWDKAIDYNIFDHLGNKWIDFTSMIFVANVGHGNKHVISKVEEALNKPILGCYAYPNDIRANYLERLVKFAGPNFEKAFLLSAGTEATEAAFKLMKMNGQKIGKRKNVVIAASGNWHGRTLAAQMLSDNVSQRAWINHEQKDIVHIAFPYPWVLDGKNSIEFLKNSLRVIEEKGLSLLDDVCGVMLETFQGWGAIFYPMDYIQELRSICDENKILLCFDEMQSGFGRTGKNFGYEHYGVRADLICCGKGMGGGFPISGVIGKAQVMDLPETGNMSSTHSGNPVMCAAGLGVLDEIETKNLVKESERKGRILHIKLLEIKNKFPKIISGIYGEGLIASILFHVEENDSVSFQNVSIVTEKCMQKGLLVVHTGRESIKIGPPLTITDDALIEGVAIISESIQEVYNDQRS
jgi:4-aminobutyrate aminotransferase-like enzyme